MLTEDQKRSMIDISRYLLASYEDDSEELMDRVVTQDETLVHHFDPESKKQSMQWKHHGSPPHKKFKRVSSAGKVMASVFWDNQGVTMVNYLEKGKRCFLCRRTEAAASGDCEEEERKVDSRSFFLSG